MPAFKDGIPALVFLALISFVTVAHAAGKANAEPQFKNFVAVKDYLSSHGMDPMKVQWGPIDLMCSGLKNGADDLEYNKCEYKKARDSILFDTDHDQCTIRAKAAYPDSLLTGKIDTLTETDLNGVVHNYQRQTAAISTAELEQDRNASLIECMQKLNWINADDWTMGKRDMCPSKDKD